jgi:hypothetical protein
MLLFPYTALATCFFVTLCAVFRFTTMPKCESANGFSLQQDRISLGMAKKPHIPATALFRERHDPKMVALKAKTWLR